MRETDQRGKRCPAPVIALGQLAKECGGDDEVTVLSDDPAAEHDIPAWCRMRNSTLVSAEPLPDGSGTRYVVRLGNAGSNDSASGSSRT